jgi:hypothetical protein
MCHGSKGDVLAGCPEEPCLQDVYVFNKDDRLQFEYLSQHITKLFNELLSLDSATANE